VRHEGCTKIFERLPARDVIEVRMTVDDVFDRRRRDLADFLDIGLRSGPAQPNRIGRDHTFRRDNEHRLVAHVAEDVDVVGAVDLGGAENRRRGRRRRLRESRSSGRHHAERNQQPKSRDVHAPHMSSVPSDNQT
jgi:hypothetical protein